MKSNCCLFILLAFFEVTTAQRICPLDGNMGLLYLEKKGEVIIKTGEVGSGFYCTGGIYKFKNAGGVIKCKMESYDSSDYGQDYEASLYWHYPEHIKIRNNGFLLSNSESDSLVLDSKGRAIEVYRKMGNQLAHAIRFKLRYLNDTTVIENALIPGATDSNRVTIFELDAKFNLKALKEGDLKKNFFDVEIGDIDVFNITRFNYDKTCTRIINIEMLAADATNKMILQSTHTFIYRNNKPIKSFVYDMKKKAVVYEQVYIYK